LAATAGSLVILDRDGVVNVDSDDYVRSADEWQPLPGSLEAIAKLHAHGYRVVVVSNQSGIGRGLFTERALEAIDAKMTRAVEAAGGRLSGIYYCPHRPDEGCDCRKPAPGLLRRIERDLGVALEGVPFVGDKASDVLAAQAVGARPILVQTGKGAAAAATLADADIEVYANLAEAAERLIDERR
jgi:D-glycero-D-manno-heptose 1,7-bisphosphate phosphatase